MIRIAGPYTFDVLSYALVAGAAIALAMAYAVWRRRATPAAVYLALLEVAIAIWCFTGAFEVASTTVPLKLLWSQISYLGITACSPLYYLFISSYSQRMQHPRGVEIALLAVVPAITILLAATNPRHGLIWPDIVMQPGTHLAVYAHGPWFYVMMTYSYLLLASGMAQLVLAIVRTRALFRTQAGVLLAASLFPILGNAVYVFDVNPLPGMDWTPLGFVFSGLFLAAGVLYWRILDLTPVARARLLDVVSDAVLLTDAQGRVADLNPAMRALAKAASEGGMGMPAAQLLVNAPDILEMLQVEDGERALTLAQPGGVRHYDVRISSLRDRADRLAGRLLVVRDVTERRNQEAERQALAQELQQAVEELRTLSGLLPMCPLCKKIRDDRGYWHTVEVYVRDHSMADFTHGICPDCMQRLYPELADPT